VSALKTEELAELRKLRPQTPRLTSQLKKQAREVVAGLDDRGAWVRDGRLRYHGKADETRRVIDSATFIRNLGILSRYLSAADKDE
jgi:hypothetical protein